MTRQSWWSTAVAMIVGGALIACAPAKRSLIRNELVLLEKAPIVKEGVTVSAKVYGNKELAESPRYRTRVDIYVKNYKGVPVARTANWTLCNAPCFELAIANTTGHVLRMTGTVIKLLDAAGNSYDAQTKEMAAAGMEESIDTFVADESLSMDQRSIAKLVRASGKLKRLGPNAQILPNFTETFVVDFQIPGLEPTLKAWDAWLAENTTMKLVIFDVPAETDEAGNATKKVHFEIPIEIRSFQEVWQGRKLLSSTPVTKS